MESRQEYKNSDMCELELGLADIDIMVCWYVIIALT